MALLLLTGVLFLRLFHDGRSRLKNEVANLDQQGGRSKYIGGSGKNHPSIWKKHALSQSKP